MDMFKLRFAMFLFFLSLPLFSPGKIIAATQVFAPGNQYQHRPWLYSSGNGQIYGLDITLSFGIAGTIAFLLMVYGFILMATSSGDPKALQGPRKPLPPPLWDF